MNIKIENTEGKNFKATTTKATFDVIPQQISPVELFGVGMISCSGVDIVMLSEKSGYVVKNLSIEADILRNENPPQKFNEIHLIYKFDSSLENSVAKKWVLSSLETYCSTINTVRESARVFFTIIYNNHKIADRASIISGNSGENFGEIGTCCQ